MLRDFDGLWHELDHPWIEDDMKEAICRTILRLPEDVQDFVVEKCSFIEALDDLHGQSHKNIFSQWIIILSPSILEDGGQAQFTIAHEIAHAYRGDMMWDGNPLAEEQADDLVKSWGFEIPQYRLEVHAYHRKEATPETDGN